MKIKKGDTVLVITGKDRGRQGAVQEVDVSANKVTVESINIVKRHMKAQGMRAAEIIEKDRKRKETENKAQDFTCANHPHNYYLELLSEAGIIGFILITLL